MANWKSEARYSGGGDLVTRELARKAKKAKRARKAKKARLYAAYNGDPLYSFGPFTYTFFAADLRCLGAHSNELD